MNEPRASLLLLDNRRRYAPYDDLSFECRISGVAAEGVDSLEVSVLWHTEGKGDEDLAVHFFERLPASGDAPPPLAARFTTRLPACPQTYQGVIVKLRWCVRLRVYLANGKQLLDEQMFQLGDVAPARAVLL